MWSVGGRRVITEIDSASFAPWAHSDARAMSWMACPAESRTNDAIRAFLTSITASGRLDRQLWDRMVSLLRMSVDALGDASASSPVSSTLLLAIQPAMLGVAGSCESADQRELAELAVGIGDVVFVLTFGHEPKDPERLAN